MSSHLPWNDPSAIGYRHRTLPPYDYAYSIGALSGVDTLLVHALRDALLEFARLHKLEPECKEIPGGDEGWTLAFFSDRMERLIQIRVTRPVTAFGRLIAIRTLAHWIDMLDDSRMRIWETNLEPRCFGLTTRTPPESFREVLELARHDALAYTTADLEPIPIDERGRPTGLPWAWGVGR